MKVLFVVNDVSYFISHRMKIGLDLIDKGYEVHVVSSSNTSDELIRRGFYFHSLNMTRDGKNPLSELFLIFHLFRLFKKVRPSLVHLVTMKPYLYGGIAARLAKVPAVVSAVAGLGILFSDSSFKSRFLRTTLYPLYKLAFAHKNQVAIFQNTNDRDLLVAWKVLSIDKCKLIRGAGVDLSLYPYTPEPTGTTVVSFAARLLKDKGVVEFVAASILLKQRGVNAIFRLIGAPDLGNSNSITQSQLDEWQENGVVECLGFRTDIASLFAKSNIVVLPSYYGEGLPKVLIEAAACGRAVVTTDHPGCRDAIEPDLTGVLVSVRDSVSLANAIENMIVNEEKRKAYGMAGRDLAEREFAIDKIVLDHFKIYEGLK